MIHASTEVEGLAAASRRHVALCRIGSMVLAAPVDHVREALPVPATFAALPWRVEGLVGAVNRRGTVIPVFDPGRFLGLDGTAATPESVILVLAHDHRVLGLRVDALLGMEYVDAGLVHALAPLVPAAGTRQLCAEAYARPGDGAVVDVLDTAALFRDFGLPLASEVPAKRPVVRGAGTGRGRPCLTFQCGPLRFAIDAMLVHSVITEPVLQTCRMPTAVWRHDVEHRGVRLAVLDLVRLAGFDASGDGDEHQVLVLRLPSGLVGFQTDRIVDIVGIDAVDVHPVPALVVPRVELFSGVVEQGEGLRTLVVDSVGLAMDPGVAGMSRLNIASTSGAASATTDVASAAATETWLRYSIGTDVVTPLAQITEILPLPASVVPVAAGVTGVAGLFTHRGRAIPLIALHARLDLEAPPPGTGCVLVVDSGDRSYGFVVHGLRSIERGREAPAEGAADDAMHDGGGRMVVVDPGPRQRFFRGIDLVQTARAIEGEVAATGFVSSLEAEAITAGPASSALTEAA